MKSLIIMILDESGSMASRMEDVIVGFNLFLKDQKEIEVDAASVIFVKFNSVVSVGNECSPIKDIDPLSTASYKPNGSTALYDGIWEGIRLGEKKEAGFDRVLCIILTDGEENSSRMITGDGIRNVIKSKEAEGKWTFIYIGENPDRWAKQTGISGGNVVAYEHDRPRRSFQIVQAATRSYRSGPQIQQQQLMENSLNSALVEPKTE